jgi:hypothetical protein
MKPLKAPQIRSFNLKHKNLPFRPPIIAERRTICAKAYGIEVRCYWELFAWMESLLSIVQVESEHSLHQTQLEKKTSPQEEKK